jgi:hypothetical protein
MSIEQHKSLSYNYLIFDHFRIFSAIKGLPLALGLVAALGGCGDRDLPPGITKKAVAIGEVPEPLRSAAKKAIPGVDFNEAWQNLGPEGKLHSYEIRGRQASNGKIREVRVSQAGEILESE